MKSKKADKAWLVVFDSATRTFDFRCYSKGVNFWAADGIDHDKWLWDEVKKDFVWKPNCEVILIWLKVENAFVILVINMEKARRLLLEETDFIKNISQLFH